MTPDLAELEALAREAPEGPWFAAEDDASDAPPHRKSGLALVDTGRQEDWPIARLTEWHTAKYIAACSPEVILALIARVRDLEEACYEADGKISDLVQTIDAAKECIETLKAGKANLVTTYLLERDKVIAAMERAESAERELAARGKDHQ
jgi:hypothetical protein